MLIDHDYILLAELNQVFWLYLAKLQKRMYFVSRLGEKGLLNAYM